MKIVCVITLAVLVYGVLNACATAAPQHDAVAIPKPLDCARVSDALVALEHGNLVKVNAVVQNLTCFVGAQAEVAEEVLGNLVATHPKDILSAFHANETPEVVIQDVAANPSSKYVDDSCGLLRELDHRLIAIQSVHEFARERDIAVLSIKQFKLQVSKHCAANE